MSITSNDFYSQLKENKLLPLYTTTNLMYLTKLEELLINHGISLIEVTYRSELASKSIKKLAQSERLVVGAGTVRTLDQAKDAAQNGAQFIVSPSLVGEVVEFCLDQNIPILPGTVTPHDIQLATEYGINVVKFFPADIYGGLKAIKSLSAPYFDVQFVPTGGVNINNAKEFISNDHVLAVGGSFIISENLIAKDNGISANKNLDNIMKELL